MKRKFETTVYVRKFGDLKYGVSVNICDERMREICDKTKRCNMCSQRALVGGKFVDSFEFSERNYKKCKKFKLTLQEE